jgi:pyruvate/2-oxoglutarate dehydrogenase complex dihydrolipoamide dehydrogenase (E3) component
MASARHADRYDTVVIGAGPGGRGAARTLTQAGQRVAMVEAELVGGECPYWACIPSKTLLRPGEALTADERIAGVGRGTIDWPAVVAYRDYMNSGLDDSSKASAAQKAGIDVLRGRGRIDAPGQVSVAGRDLVAENVVIATGTTPSLPELPGLRDVEYWTNREASTLREVPASAIVLGGGPVGIELAQMLHRFGSQVSLVHPGPRLLEREHHSVGELLGELLCAEGISVHTDANAESVAAVGDSPGWVTMTLRGDAQQLTAERLVIATGREPRVEDLGLEEAGVRIGERGVEVDASCRAAEGIWAIGDVTGVAPFTHVAAYQARIAAASILGKPSIADYRAIPRVVFGDPEIACVGTVPGEEDGLLVAQSDLSAIDRTETYGRGLRGHLGLAADPKRRVLLGAWAIGPLASEWIHQAALAVKAQIPLGMLADSIMQFPTFSELFGMLARELHSQTSHEVEAKLVPLDR